MIIEDDCADRRRSTRVYRGTIVRRRAVLAAGTVLTRGTPVYDLVRGEVYKATAEMPLIIPEGAVDWCPGSRAITHAERQRSEGLIAGDAGDCEVSRRKTELSLALEDLLR